MVLNNLTFKKRWGKTLIGNQQMLLIVLSIILVGVATMISINWNIAKLILFITWFKDG